MQQLWIVMNPGMSAIFEFHKHLSHPPPSYLFFFLMSKITPKYKKKIFNQMKVSITKKTKKNPIHFS